MTRGLVALFVLAAPWAAAQETDPTLLARARAILERAPLIDTHNDLPSMLIERNGGDLAGLDLGVVQPQLCADIPRLREGGVGAQYWSVYTDSANMKTNRSLHEALREFDVVLRVVRSRPELELARSADDIERIHRSGRIASLIGVEGGHMIEGSLAVLRVFHELGARYLTLTHWDTVEWADSATDRNEHEGLTEFGESVVREANRVGMFVDLSHVSAETMRDALRVSRAPVIFSHSNARAINPHVRNVPDDVLALLPRNGGVVHVNFIKSFVSPGDPGVAGTAEGRARGPAGPARRPEGRGRGHRRVGEGEPPSRRDDRGGRGSHRPHPEGRRHRSRRDRGGLLRRRRHLDGPRAEGRVALPLPVRRAAPPGLQRRRPAQDRRAQPPPRHAADGAGGLCRRAPCATGTPARVRRRSLEAS